MTELCPAQKTRRIALLMPDDAYCRGVVQGIYEYARPSLPWMLHRCTVVNAEGTKTIDEWQPDAVIGNFLTGRIRGWARDLKVPAVNIGSSTDTRLVTICVDNDAVGRLQARHLLDRGYRNLAYYGHTGFTFTHERFTGYANESKEAGINPVNGLQHFSPGTTWTQMDQHIRQWIRGLNHPVGIAAARDADCRILAEIAWELNLRIPDDVALIGVDDDEIACRMMYPPLSSVQLPTQKIGYLAAETINKMLCHEPINHQTILLPVGVTTRGSTDAVAIDDAIVSRAISLMRERVSRPTTVEDILQELMVSRRTLENRFRKAVGRTPLQEIRRRHIERAGELLANTDKSMDEIARLSGFASSSVLASTFRKETGETPTSYRRRNRRQ